MKRLELPAGIKIEFKDIKSATEKITSGAEMKVSALSRETNTLEQIAEIDPNVYLVALRVEIEKRIRSLAEQHDIDARRRSLRQLLNTLQRCDVLDPQAIAGLEELVVFGNQAAHGAEVSADAATWALNKGPQILGFLDGLLERTEL
ncbi:MAG: DUF4145 domain-containing protein [Planctomycetota bacterium]